MEDEDEPVSPFWLSNRDKRHRKPINNLLQRSSSFVLNSAVFIILLLVLALLFIFIIIPSIRNAASQIFKPQSFIKKSWDYVNLVLVLFAVVCAFLGRNNEDENQNIQNQSFGEHSQNGVASVSSRSQQNQWYENADRGFSNRSFNRIKSSNSYPDLRQESLLAGGDDQRFYDDTRLIDQRVANEDQVAHHRRIQSLPEMWQDLSQNIEIRSQSKRVVCPDPVYEENPEETIWMNDGPQYAPQAALPRPLVNESPLPDPPSPRQSTAVRRSHRARPKEEKLKRPVMKSKQELIGSNYSRAPPPPPPPEILTPPLSPPPPEKKIGKGDRKRSGSNSRSRKDLSALLDQQKLEKKQRRKSLENLDAMIQPPSPPPPPPPPSSAVTTPKISKLKSSSSSSSTTKKTSSLINTIIDYDSNNLSSGNNSPNRIPPPPPPPPFRMTNWKFAVRGDYVRINSTGSSSSDSPDFDQYYETPTTSNVTDETDGRDSPPLRSPVFCPSPDVDSKADNFIARVRAGLKLEKMISINDKQRIGLSKLGPEPSTSPNPSSD